MLHGPYMLNVICQIELNTEASCKMECCVESIIKYVCTQECQHVRGIHDSINWMQDLISCTCERIRPRSQDTLLRERRN